MSSLEISRHAIDRFRERVDPNLSAEQAEIAIADVAARGKRTTTPRQWLPVSHRPRRGGAYVFSPAYPGVCLVVGGSTVKTVLTPPTCNARSG